MTSSSYPLAALALRLHPDDDLRLALEDYARFHRIEAAFVLACVGSLSTAALRYAQQPRPVVVSAAFEIIALSGSISRDGAHLHAVVADGDGRVSGGHVSRGCIIRTTAEILLGVITGTEFTRQLDAQTGYSELVISAPSSSSRPAARQSRKRR